MKNFEMYKTAEEREKAFQRWCKNNRNQILGTFCKIKNDMENCFICQFAWLDLEAEEDEEPLPCPLCGARMRVSGTFLKCTGCGLGFSYGLTTNDVTSAFNRVSRAVMKEKEGDK